MRKGRGTQWPGRLGSDLRNPGLCMCRCACVSLRTDYLTATPLQKGDEVQCEIEELGVIINKVV